MKILLVDDDPGVVQSLVAMLPVGHESRTAFSGEEALAVAASLGGVDLLITDVVMEPMDGFTLRDQLLGLYPEMRTILVSGYDLSDYPEQTQNHQLLAKPVDLDTLRAAVERETPPPVEEAVPEPEPEPAPVPVAVPVAVRAAVPVAVAASAVPVARPTAVPAAAQPVRPAAVKAPTVRAAVPPGVARPTAVPVARAAVPAPVAAAPVAVPVPATPVAVPRAAVAAVPVKAPTAVAAPSVPTAVPATPVAVPSARPAVQAVPRAAVAPQAPQAAPAPVAVPVARAAVPSAPAVPAVPVTAVPVAPVSKVPTVKAASAIVPRSGSVATQVVSPAPGLSAPAVPVAAVAARPSTVAPPPYAGPSVTTNSGEDLSGQALGAYFIQRKIGAGAWGDIYAAVQTSINRPVALEILSFAHASEPAAVARFAADARAKAAVQHPSILAVYEAGDADGRFFYAYESVSGRTIADLKANGEKIDEATAIKILRVAADGLAYFAVHNTPHSAPEAGSIHLGNDGHPRLANLAAQMAPDQLMPQQEIPALGRILLSVLPAIQSLTQGLRDLLKRMVQPGPEALSSWGQVLQGVKAIEPKIVPVDSAKISAHDRAAIAAVELARKQQKKTMYYNIGSLVSLLLLLGGVIWYFFHNNERTLDDQVHIPAGDFIFANGQKKTLPEFWIDKYEVTYGQYAKFVEYLEGHPDTKYDHPQQPRSKASVMHKPPHWSIYYGQAKANGKAHSTPIDLNSPVMEVDFWDAYAYAKWKDRELPTEEEWEKAARGTDGFIYPWGEDPDPKKANSNADFNPNDPGAKGTVDGYNFWNPVDKIKGDKSPFGVIGMAGNVREWTSTWDNVKKRPIIKGGSFMSSDVRLDQRTDTVDMNQISEAIGFRTISRTPPK